jgi:hypothetical protein
MIGRYGRLISEGKLGLRRPPHQDTQSIWMNDSDLTPTLFGWLGDSGATFRKCERGGIVDSSKTSQLRTAHARYIEFGEDVRVNADWMKVHLLVGVETLVVMAADFQAAAERTHTTPNSSSAL